ncbi:hypothetical protein JRQ81_011585 [Phrynocephalus forsythii]|uniref:Claudin n=1 Tax=Phrynocephalus forsythii TaxID=171643 RepID=A0A9Q1AQB3_9SAUR|nr:hypothetical protein JRQ81_011585 [Phrynocephalus forsythii]
MADYFKHFQRPAIVGLCISAVSQCGPVVWLKSLKITGQLRLGGVLLSCLATCLVVAAVSTEYWVKRFVRGIFIFRGLWKDCQQGKCTPLEQMPSYIGISIFFMLISVAACYGSVIFGTLCLTALPPSKKTSWITLTITLCTISGFTGGIGLFNFMRSATEEPNTFLSWSLAPGWFSVIVVSMAGVCHFVAKNWEEEELAEQLLANTTGFTLQEACTEEGTSEYSLHKKKRRKPESDTSV